MAKITVIKVTAEGEQLSIEGEFIPDPDVQIAHPPDATHKDRWETTEKGKPLLETLQPYFDLCDDRLFEMNQRILASNHLVKQLEPAAQMAVHHVCEVLMGQAPKSDISNIMKQRDAEREAQLAHLAEEEKKLEGKGDKKPPKPTSH